MRKYRFRLEPVLRYRTLVEDQLCQKLAVIELEHIEQQNKLGSFQEAQEKGRKEFLHKRMDGITTSQIILYNTYLDDLAKKISSQRSRLADISRRMEEARQNLLKASKERKMLEKSKEKKLQQYLGELTKAEQNFIDEVSASQYLRASS